jgi:UDP-N-acetylmuramate dehydrogenase
MKNLRAEVPILENVPLAPFTTLGIGGPARFLIKVTSEDGILDAIEFARARGCRVFVLGGGSNLVVSDSGFSGVVLKIELAGIQSPDDEGGGEVSVSAGVEWDEFVQYCVARNLAGIECLSGIPGTVGGTPIQNVGAHGEEVGEVISRVRAWDRVTDQITGLSNAQCRFAYRSSIFNTTHRDRYIVLSVDFSLRSDGLPRIHYPDLQKRFADRAQPPTLSEVRETVLQTRKAKAMVLCDGDPDTKSAGSFFKNPILKQGVVVELEEGARSRGFIGPSESIPRFASSPGNEKLPAAWLIEHSGFHKGYVHKNAGISSKHALALINRGGATAQEILELMHLIQARVQEIFGIELKPEPIFVGDFPGIPEPFAKRWRSMQF